MIIMATDTSLLDANEDAIYKQLLLQASEEGALGPNFPNPQSIAVVPKPGFCLKTKTSEGEKIFINVCTGENLPDAKDIDDEELVKLLDSDDPSGFRIPMSLGEPHAELDNSGNGCTAYDVVVNPAFYGRMEKSKLLHGFFLTVVLEGLEYKYKMELDREWKILKNRKFVGTLPEQNVRTQSKPWIMDMGSDEKQSLGPQQSGKSLISEVSSTETKEQPKPKAPEPPYTIIQEPPEGHPDFLVAEIHLPKIKSAASLTLDIGEDRIVLATRSHIYGLDIYLPYDLIQEHCTAQFNIKTKILTLTLPVQPAFS